MIQNEKRTNLDPMRLSKLIFIKYNKIFHERFQRRRIKNKSEDYDLICVDELNYNLKWMMENKGSCNEFVEVDNAMGTSDSLINVRLRRIFTVRGHGHGEFSTCIQIYSIKKKKPPSRKMLILSMQMNLM